MSGNAANTLGDRAKTVRNTKGKPSYFVRNSLQSPYSCIWPDLQSGTTPKILEEVNRTFKPLQDVLGKRRTKNRKRTAEMREEQTDDEKEQERKKKELRSQLALGVNEVTRCLEKDLLRLVMVCRSTKPEIMTSHLCALSATRQCPAMAVFNLSKTLAPLLNMKHVLAIGFKKPTDTSFNQFDQFVMSMTEKCPPIKLGWLELKNLPPKDVAEIITFRSQKKLHEESKHASEKQCKGNQDEELRTDPENENTSVKQAAGIEDNTQTSTSSNGASHTAKTQKLENRPHPSESWTGGGKKQKIVAVPYVSTKVKPVKIISKALKGKKVKKKKGKKK